MIQETQEIIHRDLNFLPLKSYANIFEGNALRMDWEKILPPDINFIFGNPPFVGRRYRTREQVEDISKFFTYKDVDYVACWYKKTYEFLIFAVQKINQPNFCSTKIQCAFVSTNSITQGEQVAAIFETTPFIINFAYRTFRWDSESNEKAHVHCVIIVSHFFTAKKKLFLTATKNFLRKI